MITSYTEEETSVFVVERMLVIRSVYIVRSPMRKVTPDIGVQYVCLYQRYTYLSGLRLSRVG